MKEKNYNVAGAAIKTNNFSWRKIFYYAATFLVFILSLSGCKNFSGSKKNFDDQSSYKKINAMLMNLKSYRCKANVKYISNKNTIEYVTIQECKSDGKYKIEIIEPENSSGNITLNDGEKICQFNSKINGRVTLLKRENMERSEIFLPSFIKNYCQSLETSVSVAALDKSKCTVLEALIPSNHPYLSSEKLFIDNKTAKPVELVIYDKDNSERIIVSFIDFEYNVELDDSLFKI